VSIVPIPLGLSTTTVLAGSLSMAVQLVVCLALGALLARRSGRDLVTWLFIGFGAAVLPVAGLLAMIVAMMLVKAPAASS
jgi:hypothetical protein